MFTINMLSVFPLKLLAPSQYVRSRRAGLEGDARDGDQQLRVVGNENERPIE